MMKNLKQLTPVALSLGLAMASAGAQATTISSGLVGGLNDIIDESRETYVDVNADGKFNAGDVIYGYIRISDFQPSGLTGNNQVYGVFSQEITSASAGRNVHFKPTTVAGLTLKDLLSSDANVDASAIAAFYDKPTPFVDLINSNPPGPPTSMAGYVDYIHDNGTLRMVAGFSDPDDFLYSEISAGATAAGVTVGGSNAPFVTALSSFTIASNSGAFTLSYNATGFFFKDTVPVIDPSGTLVLAEVAVSSGTTGGAAGASVKPSPKNWLNAGGGFAQCLTTAGDTDCGFTDKNNFTVDVVPEPGSLALISLALLSLTGFARSRKHES